MYANFSKYFVLGNILIGDKRKTLKLTVKAVSLTLKFCLRSLRLSMESVDFFTTSNLNWRESTDIPSFLAWFCNTPVRNPGINHRKFAI